MMLPKKKRLHVRKRERNNYNELITDNKHEAKRFLFIFIFDATGCKKEGTTQHTQYCPMYSEHVHMIR